MCRLQVTEFSSVLIHDVLLGVVIFCFRFALFAVIGLAGLLRVAADDSVVARNMSAKAARSDPSWNPSIAGRELLKPKFYDVWFEVSGKKEAIVTNSNSTKPTSVKDGAILVRDSKTPALNPSWKVVGKDGQLTKHKVEDCGTALKEMQRLMQVQLQVRLPIRNDSILIILRLNLVPMVDHSK